MSKKRRKLFCDEATILTVQRLIEGPYLASWPAAHQFTEQHGVVDCNSLLDIQDDSEFIDAAYRQLCGRDVTDRRHRRWVRRLRTVSRAFMLVCLRYSRDGKQHSAQVPGLWWALLFDQPFRHVPLPIAGPALVRLRRRVVEANCPARRDEGDAKLQARKSPIPPIR